MISEAFSFESEEDEADFLDPNSIEFTEVEDRVRRAVRQMLKEGVPFEIDQYARSPEICAALGEEKVSKNSLRHLILPYLDARSFVWQEYEERGLWNLSEAASLAAGMDPLVFDAQPRQYHTEWRMGREKTLQKLKEALLNQDLPSIQEGPDYYVTPREFGVWARKQGLLNLPLAKRLHDFSNDQVGEGGLDNEVISGLDLNIMRERFVTNAEQMRIEKERNEDQVISLAEQRQRSLFAFAVWVKFDDPTLGVGGIKKLAVNALSEECRKLPGFKPETIRSNLYAMSEKVVSPEEPSVHFLISSVSKVTLTGNERSDPTHQWWILWRPILQEVYPWLELPE